MPIFFWTGEEDFLIHEKQEAWQKAFVEKHGGDINLSVLDGKEMTAGELTADFESVPFLGDKRLIFVKNLPPQAIEKLDAKKSEALTEALEHIPESTVLVFLQAKPDKRTSFYKALIKHAQVENFSPLKAKDLEAWILKYVKQKGGDILPSALPFFLEQAGSNLWKLSSEIEKLLAYTNKEKAISENDIRKIVVPVISSNVFHFLDAISAKQKEKALKELKNILEQGESLMQLFALFTKHIRSFLLAKSISNVSKDALVKTCKLHPFVAQKILQSLKNFSEEELVNMYQKFLSIDEGIKTGKISLSTGNEKALALEIEKMILKF